MALPRGQVDRFGNPIPPNQSVKVFINADGTVPRQRETVKLDSTLTATDDPDSQATILSATGAPFVVLSNTVFTGASVTIPFTANTYKRIDVTIDWGAGTLDTIALTGMDAAKYNNGFNYATGIASANTSDLDNWPKPAGSTAGKGFAKFTVSVPPAPALKGLEFNGCYVNIPATIRGVHTDTTHDPTAIVVTFDASRTGYVYAIGYK